MNNKELLFWDITKEIILAGVPIQKIEMPENIKGIHLSLSVLNKNKVRDDVIMFYYYPVTDCLLFGARNLHNEEAFVNLDAHIEVHSTGDLVTFMHTLYQHNDIDLLNHHGKILSVYKPKASRYQSGRLNHFGVEINIFYTFINDDTIEYEAHGTKFITSWKSLITPDCLTG